MKRREILTAAAGVAAASVMARPAIAQGRPKLKWRMVSSFPKSLDTSFGAGVFLAKRVSELTEGGLELQVFAPGEIVGGLEALDAVSNDTVECCHSVSFYGLGKDISFAVGSGLPFIFNARQLQAWTFEGGGLNLMNEFYSGFNLWGHPCGNTGAQMGGWFRKEIATLDDLKGLKMRIGAMGGQILLRLGVVPQQIAGGDIYAALERGTIDAVEWSGAYDDEKLGFARVAKYYYSPGWWEGGPMLHFFVNLKRWNDLPASYQAALTSACHEANNRMLAQLDARNGAALKRLVGTGVQLRLFSKEILDACYNETMKLYDELSAKNPKFAKLYASINAIRGDMLLYQRIAELPYDSFVYSRSSGR
ncbi:TRAP transporter substrate-binding protein [Bosea vaviloviae]|uniref:ABC transporter substrate-binding protein n=1 Tax=Bosea vaviloviae TaxID=1526658 RepID=A0A1D7UC20_9HYPH|nr:TRAP transporter substrate-binding protein DctP [Bosea vaviloviae]AOO84922.1 ABC transporter substrate-binding protein [Bosea vaviloviae]